MSGLLTQAVALLYDGTALPVAAVAIAAAAGSLLFGVLSVLGGRKSGLMFHVKQGSASLPCPSHEERPASRTPASPRPGRMPGFRPPGTCAPRRVGAERVAMVEIDRTSFMIAFEEGASFDYAERQTSHLDRQTGEVLWVYEHDEDADAVVGTPARGEPRATRARRGRPRALSRHPEPRRRGTIA